MTSVFLDNVSKEFSGGAKALTELTLRVEQGELLVVVGPSGSGKTTVLRIIAGLETPTRGSIRFDGVDVASFPAWQRGTALVAESAALLPHATIAENMLWSRKQRKGTGWDRWWPWPRHHRSQSEQDQDNEQGQDERSVAERELKSLAQQLGLSDFLERRPHALSAGQQQRVALGRALLAQPRVLLLDEPLGRLDGTRRSDLARELKRIHRLRRTTWIYVTHDRHEAVTVADRVAVLEGGRLLQVGKPKELSTRPKHRLVVAWETDGALTVMEGVWRWRTGRVWFHSRWLREPVPLVATSSRGQGRLEETIESQESPHAVEAIWKPDQVIVELAEAAGLNARPNAGPGEITCLGMVEEIEERGTRVLVWVALIDPEGSVETPRDPIGDHGVQAKDNERYRESGSEDTTAPQRRGRIVGVQRADQQLHSGALVRVRFDWARAHWFDSVSGQTMSVGEEDV